MYGGMYAFSRAMYRDLASDIIEDPHTLGRCTHHERVLRACEAAVERLMTDRRYFARPARTLFGDIRAYFPMNSQLRVLRVIERHVALVDVFLRSLPQNGLDAMGKPLQCRACTRRGTPCKRMPLPHNGYCPSHQHLAETDVMGPSEAEVVALRRPEPVAA
jgi:hypothetical protein